MSADGLEISFLFNNHPLSIFGQRSNLTISIKSTHHNGRQSLETDGPNEGVASDWCGLLTNGDTFNGNGTRETPRWARYARRLAVCWQGRWFVVPVNSEQ